MSAASDFDLDQYEATVMAAVRPAQTPPCPSWCGEPEGHDDWSVLGEEIHRFHERAFGLWRVGMVETVDLAGGVTVEPVNLSIGLRDCLEDAADVRALQRDLAAAADLFASIKAAGTEVAR